MVFVRIQLYFSINEMILCLLPTFVSPPPFFLIGWAVHLLVSIRLVEAENLDWLDESHWDYTLTVSGSGVIQFGKKVIAIIFLYTLWKISIAIKRTEWLSGYMMNYLRQGLEFDSCSLILIAGWHSSVCRLSCVFSCPLTSFSREELLDQYWPLCSTGKWNWKQKQ